MKNLNYLNSVEIDEFDLIKNSKNLDARARLNNIRPDVLVHYNLYLHNFDTIQQIGASTFNLVDSADLRGCYLIKTASRDNLLKRIVGNQTAHFKHICPYCLILPRTTYDHYIPEGSYPVYSILAKNLVPCCTTCNGKKLEYWRVNGSRGIIHFYIDLIPQIQFLFGSLLFNQNNIPSISFDIQQTVGIADALFEILTNHFQRLNLRVRYADRIDLVVSDIIDDVESNRLEFGNILTTQSISNIILNKSNRYKQQYGVNYWKSISMDLLANSMQFLNGL